MSLPKGEYYCLYIVFKDGNKRVFYSRDRKSSKSKFKNDHIGLVRLLKLAQKHTHSAENMSIYDHREGNPSNGTLIWQVNRDRTLVNKVEGI